MIPGERFIRHDPHAFALMTAAALVALAAVALMTVSAGVAPPVSVSAAGELAP